MAKMCISEYDSVRRRSVMIKFAIAIAMAALAIGLNGMAKAQWPSGGQRVVPMGYCYSSSLSSATKLTAFTCNMVDGGTIAAEIAFIQSAAVCVYNAGVVWRDDGAVPTSTTPAGGEGVSAATCFTYNGQFSSLQFVQQSAGAGVGLMLYR